MEEDDIFESEELYMDDQESSYVEDKEDSDDRTDSKVGTVIGFVENKFSKQRKQISDEQRWIKAYQNYRGIYGPDVQFTSTEKSRVFVKVTKTKVLAAYGQIVDVLFGSNKFPISINPSTLPDGVEESVNFETNPEIQKAAEKDFPDLNYLQPGETIIDLQRDCQVYLKT